MEEDELARGATPAQPHSPMEPVAAPAAADCTRVDISSSASGAVLEFGGTRRARRPSARRNSTKAIAKVAAVKARRSAAAASAPAAAEDVPIRVCVRVRPTLESEAKSAAKFRATRTRATRRSSTRPSSCRSAAVVTLSEARKLGNPTGEIAARKFVAHRAFAPEESNDAVYADAIALVACVQAGRGARAGVRPDVGGQDVTIEAVSRLRVPRCSRAARCGSPASRFAAKSAPTCSRRARRSSSATMAPAPLCRAVSRSFPSRRPPSPRRSSPRRAARARHATRSNDVSSRSHAVCALGSAAPAAAARRGARRAGCCCSSSRAPSGARTRTTSSGSTRPRRSTRRSRRSTSAS